jgi:hypothetical protein
MSEPVENTEPQTDMRDLLGYLNFSDGTPNPKFRRAVSELFADAAIADAPQTFRDRLLQELSRLHQSGESAFEDVSQAASVVSITIDELLPAYRLHHADLLAHLAASEFYSPFLVCRMLEAVLSNGPQFGVDDRAELITAALAALNDFVGYRPVAVLENDRRMEVYDHERFCPVPVFWNDVGVAVGRYEKLLAATLGFLKLLPASLTEPAHFSMERLQEMAIDVRSHDHLHPVNKRTNYVFGEWDPDTINVKGYYTRFIIRRLILDALNNWISAGGTRGRRERLEDASIVLAGTVLMAASISGSGPMTFDSSVSLTTLLPIVARQRDNFYRSLLEAAEGDRGRRLRRLATSSREPFGHVRHELNMQLAKYGADQLQHRHLSWMYATMGYEEASCDEASVIPCLSARIESEMQSRLVIARRCVKAGDVKTAWRLIREVIELYHRGIHCGALIDPWNILGFQGQFPLFFARDDAIPDNRAEILLLLIGQIFDCCSLIMSEAAARDQMAIHEAMLHEFRTLADEWDGYATATVHDLNHIIGNHAVEAAEQVSDVIAKWRTAGESAGDISFWREHVESFQHASGFAQVVSALLDRRDHVAAMGLLMQWLNRSGETTLESGTYSIHTHLQRLMHSICNDNDRENQWTMLRRFFAFLEANAGEFWDVPTLREFASGGSGDHSDGEGDSEPDDDLNLQHLFDEDEGDSEDNLFDAAYENVTFRDSADDGNTSDTLDDGASPGTTEFELLYREIEPRLKFLHTLGALWSYAATAVVRTSANSEDAAAQIRRQLEEWLASIRKMLSGLGDLLREIRDYEIESWSSDIDANIEYDVQMQAQLLLMQNCLSTTVEFLMAERLIDGALGGDTDPQRESASLHSELSRVFHAVFAQDAAAASESLPALYRELRRRPLLYVPFENGGHPAAILKARTLQAIIRVLLAQLPRLGLLEETFVLLQTSLQMEQTSRPVGQAVTEFDRLFRLALYASTEAILHSSAKKPNPSKGQVRSTFRRLHRLLKSYRNLWIRHSSSMRLSIVEDLHDDERALEVERFIETYGDDLFHARALTLGNARAIVQQGADALLAELEESVAPYQPIKLLDDIDADVIDREEAVDLAEFVYEAVVDNFDRFIEYNTTTTQSDYGSQLYCLLDFLRLESLYERFDWNTIPWQVAHESVVRFGCQEIADLIESDVRDETAEMADAFMDELRALEKDYGVRLPTLHDRISERVIGSLTQNRLAALAAGSIPGGEGPTQDKARSTFAVLREQIEDYMSDRLGSGIEPSVWLQRLASEVDNVQEDRGGRLSDTLHEGEFVRIPLKQLDSQLSAIARRSSGPKLSS